MPRRTPSVVPAARAIGVALVLALALAGCTAPTARPTATPSAIATIAPSGDGLLRIGTLFPMTGAAAASGAAQVAGTELAGREISEQGGVLGKPIQLIHRNSAGDVAAALADLLARGVDVVFWDAASRAPKGVAASVAAARVALVPLREFVHGVNPFPADAAFSTRLRSADPGLTGVANGAEAYDGVILAALAATVAGDDGGPSIAAELGPVASGPTVCTSWGECLSALTDKQRIGYRGVTGRRS